MAANRVIATAGLISVAVGSVNAIGKNKRLPSAKFLIGSGMAFLLLSAMSEAEPELASAFAVAIATTVVIGEGGGVLTYINDGEIDTRKKSVSHTPKSTAGLPPTVIGDGTAVYHRPTIVQPGLTARPNLVP